MNTRLKRAREAHVRTVQRQVRHGAYDDADRVKIAAVAARILPVVATSVRDLDSEACDGDRADTSFDGIFG